MNLDDTRLAMLAVCDVVLRSEELLTEADMAIGDGDHGVGMSRGFGAAKQELNDKCFDSISDCLKCVGFALISKSGGASGAIFGTFFMAASKESEGETKITHRLFERILDAGFNAVTARGGAALGDKTMLDALGPARSAASDTKSFVEALKAASEAAAAGAESTKEMVAKHGKAKALGERALGHPDPGAITFSIIMKALADFSRD